MQKLTWYDLATVYGDVCPSSLDENGQPRTEGETAHRWDDTTDPVTCAECGTEKDKENS